MRVVTINTSASGTWYVPLDYHRAPFNVGIMVVPISGSPAPTISHSLEDFQNVQVSTPQYWLNHATLVSVAVTADGNYAFPVRVLRVRQEGAGDAKICIIQAGLVH